MDLVFISLYRHISTMFASYRDTCSPCHKWNGPIENIFESSATNQLLLFCCLKLQLDSSSKKDLFAHLDSDKEFATSLQNPKKWIALGPDMHKLRGWFGCTRICLPGCIIGQVCHFSGAELSPVVLITYGLVFHRPPARVPKKPIRFFWSHNVKKKHMKTQHLKIENKRINKQMIHFVSKSIPLLSCKCCCSWLWQPKQLARRSTGSSTSGAMEASLKVVKSAFKSDIWIYVWCSLLFPIVIVNDNESRVCM